MADVRALLAAERQSRRITHPSAFYNKSGILTCSLCRLAIKSETLWEGHLRSANHRKNAQQKQTTPSAASVPPRTADSVSQVPGTTRPSLKRKVDALERDEGDGGDQIRYEDGEKEKAGMQQVTKNKKTKSSRQVSFAAEVDMIPSLPGVQESVRLGSDVVDGNDYSTEKPQLVRDSHLRSQTIPEEGNQDPVSAASTSIRNQIDEDEWLAFEREIAPLKTTGSKDYSNATISADPVSAKDLKEMDSENAEEKRNRLQSDAESEREEEQMRIQEEFDVLEEMEERVRKLRERRERLRSLNVEETPGGGAEEKKIADSVDDGDVNVRTREHDEEGEKSEDVNPDLNESDDDDIDDWYS